MADSSENTPFLAENDDYDGGESYYAKSTSANAHFHRPLRIVKGVGMSLSFLTTILLIVCYVFVQIGPFENTWSAKEQLRSLGIALFINFILSAPAILFQFPILVNLAIEIAMSIVIFVFAGKLFGDSWPDSSFCRRWNRSPPNYGFLPETPECVEGRNKIRIMMGVSGGVSIVIGLMILTTLFIRLVALARTRFWEGKKSGNFGGSWLGPGTFTVQFTMSIIRKDPNEEDDNVKGKVAERQIGGGASQLIQT